jgi:hypothetical protein
MFTTDNAPTGTGRPRTFIQASMEDGPAKTDGLQIAPGDSGDALTSWDFQVGEAPGKDGRCG